MNTTNNTTNPTSDSVLHALSALPPLYHFDSVDDIHIPTPITITSIKLSWLWIPVEFDGKDLFFGLVHGFESELGYTSFQELRQTLPFLTPPLFPNLKEARNYTPEQP